jgi:hypothetical protein
MTRVRSGLKMRCVDLDERSSIFLTAELAFSSHHECRKIEMVGAPQVRLLVASMPFVDTLGCPWEAKVPGAITSQSLSASVSSMRSQNRGFIILQTAFAHITFSARWCVGGRERSLSFYSPSDVCVRVLHDDGCNCGGRSGGGDGTKGAWGGKGRCGSQASAKKQLCLECRPCEVAVKVPVSYRRHRLSTRLEPLSCAIPRMDP